MFARRFCIGEVVAALALLAPAAAHAQIAFGQADDFEDGTVQNWNGSIGQFSNQPSGGPAGANDNYLEVVGNGDFGPGSRVATFNETQWMGNYAAAGVTAIQLDMANFGATDLAMRALLLFTNSGDWTTTVAQAVPADGVWRSYTFEFSEALMTQVGGGGPFANVLANVPRILFRHESGPPAGIGGGTPIVGTLGLDNITAIPEPSSIALMSLAGLALLRRRR